MSLIKKYNKKQKITDAELQNASIEELKILKIKNDNIISQLKDKLDCARIDIKNEIYVDPKWRRKTTGARKIRGRFSQRLQAEFGRRKREQKEKNRKYALSFDKFFYSAAKMILDEKIFEEILNEAKTQQKINT